MIIPGPIGTILAMHHDLKKYKDMPYASTLCGSCTAVCPVKVDIHRQIVLWRNEVVKAGHLGRAKSAGLKTATLGMKNTLLFRMGGWAMRRRLRVLPPFVFNNCLTIWGKSRDLPKMPAKSFRAEFRAHSRSKTNLSNQA
jgi:L-lactate dehydrogenase complex protein LldF